MSACIGTRAAGLLIALALALSASGCGSVGPKQIRIESSAVSSTATEGETIASEFGRGRLGLTYAREQMQVLAKAAGGPADALGKSAVSGPGRLLAAETQALALESQRRMNDLTEHLDDRARRALDSERLGEIATRATEIADRAEAFE